VSVQKCKRKIGRNQYKCAYKAIKFSNGLHRNKQLINSHSWKLLLLLKKLEQKLQIKIHKGDPFLDKILWFYAFKILSGLNFQYHLISIIIKKQKTILQHNQIKLFDAIKSYEINN